MSITDDTTLAHGTAGPDDPPSAPTPPDDCGGQAPTCALLVTWQQHRRCSTWDYRPIALSEVEVRDPVAIMRAVEKTRQRRAGHWTLYGMTGVVYELEADPEDVWPRGDAARSWIHAPERTVIAYRLVLDLDPASADDWQETRDAALRLHDAYCQVIGHGHGLGLDAYSSGGSRCGLHLEAPTAIEGAEASAWHRILAHALASRAGVALASARTGARVKIDDGILAKVACGQVVQAPGPRRERSKDGTITVAGTGKAWIPWAVLADLRTPQDYADYVRATRERGDHALVPHWLRPGYVGGIA